ncbi:MAG: hypothetical protein M3Y56_09245 [Armatimonadota bacterium]|nr:hypothetical protein [Armatimonadota bacterium]
MPDQLTEIEGTWDQIAAHAQRFAGHNLRLTILPSEVAMDHEPVPLASDTRSLDEKLANLAASIPLEEQARLPADLCDQLDHYIYGSPRR